MSKGFIGRFLRESSWSQPVWLLGAGVFVVLAMIRPLAGTLFLGTFAITQILSLAIHFGVHRRPTAERTGQHAFVIALRDNFHLVWMALLYTGAAALIGSITNDWAPILTFYLAAGTLEAWSLGLHQRVHHAEIWFGNPRIRNALAVATPLFLASGIVALL